MTSSEQLRIGIIGAGAMGGAYGIELAAAGHEVLLVDPWEAHLDAIARDGLTMVEGDREVTRPMTAVASPEGEPPVDLLMFFVKSYETRGGSRAGAFTCQRRNYCGLASERLGKRAEARRVCADRARRGRRFLCERCPDRAGARGANGPWPDGDWTAGWTQERDRPDSVAAAFASAGYETEVDARIDSRIWKKLVLNAAANPVAALTGLRSGQMAEDPAWPLVKSVADEVILVAQAEGYELDRSSVVEERSEFARQRRSDAFLDAPRPDGQPPLRDRSHHRSRDRSGSAKRDRHAAQHMLDVVDP